jgi:DNA repair protein SbcD/Mre11
MKLVHAADLHLFSPLRGLVRYAGAPTARAGLATQRALDRLVALCIDERADLLLLAGDLFDANLRDHKAGLYFVSQMLRLREHGIRVLSVRGNHDADSRIVLCLLLPDNVIEVGLDGPETVHLEDLGVAVHGQSYRIRATFDNLVTRFPPPVRGALNVGLLHTSAEGRAGHDPYAPCTLRQLYDSGYDYWALGHVHAREVHTRGAVVVFPGNLQGRSPREPGPKGATVVTVEDGRVKALEHRAVDVVRFGRVGVSVTDAASLDDIVELATAELGRSIPDDDRVHVVRLVLDGTPGIGALLDHSPERALSRLRGAAARVADGRIWIEEAWAEGTEPPMRFRVGPCTASPEFLPGSPYGTSARECADELLSFPPHVAPA